MNRQQRRTLEKQLGLTKQYLSSSEAEKSEIRARKREMGEKIHQQNIENVYNDLSSSAEKRQTQLLQTMIENGKTEAEALAILNKNIKLQEEREAKLAERDLKRLK
jgi:hypothetical protein